MKRIVAALLLFVTVVVGGAFNFKPVDPVTHTYASIVRVETPNDEDPGNPIICTGFVIEPHRAITAAHCISDDSGFTVDGEESIAIKRDAHFALVSVSSALGSKPALKLAKQVRVQEPVLSFGFAWGDMFVLARNVAAFKGGDFATDGPLAPGMSGGPTVNQAGEVVGLNQAANSIIGIMCGAGEIRAFLSAPGPSQPQ